jgi:DNA-binding MarR family transcriptional regulator
MISAAMTLTQSGDPLAHDALESLLLAEACVRRRLASDLEREGLSASGFSVLMVLSSNGGELELRTLRSRLRTSKANATEVVTTLETRGMVQRFRLPHDRRAASVRLTVQGRELVDRLAPEHTQRVTDAFAMLDEAEKRMLSDICRKLAGDASAEAVAAPA